MRSPPRDCPCHSSRPYAACCAPAHRGERAPATVEALMRSRFSAFALGLGEYLVTTLAAEHEDRVHPVDVLARELGRAHLVQRFMGLDVLHAEDEADGGEILFVARVFEKGRDCSFGELSRFTREGGALRYASGITVRADRLPREAGRLTREAFLLAAET